LLLAVSLQQAGKRLALASREAERIRVEDARQDVADQPTELAVKKAKESLLSLGKITIAESSMHGDDGHGMVRRQLAQRCHLVIKVDRPEKLVENAAPIPLRVRDDLSARSNDQGARDVTYRGEDGVVSNSVAL
jgi:hypothetical protein